MDIRNVAIIAHVDHGKTTLVDKLISYTKALGRDSQSGNLDTNELERERGITILSKNVSMHYAGLTLSILLGTQISEARSSGCLIWPTAYSSWLMPLRGRCHKRALSYKRHWSWA